MLRDEHTASAVAHAMMGTDEDDLRAAAPPGAAAKGAGAPPQRRRTGTAANARSVWAHGRPRIAAAPPPPTEADVARMIAEFLARGGQVTTCRAAHLLPIQNGAGCDAKGWTA